jgi:methylated-DNA-[protein]-cysteine S-methyltransferase
VIPRSYTVVPSPIGDLVLTGDGTALSGLYLERPPRGLDPSWRSDARPFRAATEQLAAYFAGELREFDLPVAPVGTAFQLEVWHRLRTIPYGETRTYGAIAAAIGRPGASRAVGLANGRNPVSIVVPCHRVIGSDGTLTGYAGGLPRKRWLLAMERGEQGWQQPLPDRAQPPLPGVAEQPRGA